MIRSNYPRMFAGMALGVLLAIPAAAQQPGSAGEESPWSVRLGAVGAYMPDYEGSDDYEMRALPDIDIEYGDLFFLRRATLGVNLVNADGFQAGVSVGYHRGRDEDDNRALRGLGDINAMAMGNLFAQYSLGPLNLSATLSNDVLGDGHDGTILALTTGYRFAPTERIMLSIGPSLTWASNNYMQTMFGISDIQAARSGRQPYQAKSGLRDAGLTAFGAYKLTDNWMITSIARYHRLLGDAADSPLVARDGSADQFMVGLGLAYDF